MSELIFSPAALAAMRSIGWKCYPSAQFFECEYHQCPNDAEIARDLSDYTGYKVSHYRTSAGKGFWAVFLRTDDECLEFARKYNEYCDARHRVMKTLLNGSLLVVTQEQYNQVAEMVKRYNKLVVGDHILLVIPDDETTKCIVAILDALGM